MKPEVKHFPNCKSLLSDNPKLAQGVKECKECKTRFFIILTSYGFS